MIAGLRLAITLLTVLPVRGPDEVDRRRAGWAMAFAPAVGLGLGVFTALVVFAVRSAFGSDNETPLPAIVGLATLALLTGGLHLDGLADLADGLGARKGRERTLAIMREPTVGSFAVVALVTVLALQVFALTEAIERHRGSVTVIAAVLGSRLAIMLVCAGRTPSARPGGLGDLVLGSVPRSRAAAVLALGLLVAVVAGRFDYHGGGFEESGRVVVALLVGLLAADLLRRFAARRLGGINGDVLGAVVEVSTTVILLVMAVPVPNLLS